MRIGRKLVVSHTLLAVLTFAVTSIVLRSSLAYYLIAVVAIGASLLVIGTSYMLSNSFTTPLKRMIVMAERMANDDLEQRLPVREGDEIGELSKSLNELAEKLKARIDELSTEKAKSDLIFNNMAEGILLLNQNGEVVLTNPSIEGIFSVATADVIGNQVVHSIKNYDLDHAIQESAVNKREVIDELALQSPFKQLRIRVMPITNSLGEDQTLVVIRDITQQKQVERLRKDFVANVSHELKTPLTGLKLLSDNLLRSIDTDPASSKVFIMRLDKELSTLISLVRELIDLSKLENPQETAERIPVDLEEVVVEVCASFSQLAASSNLKLDWDIANEVPGIAGDREQIFTLVRNLVDNAIRYTPAGGKINVRVESVAGLARLAVIDSGIGLAKREIPRIFERFYRVDKARSRETGGTGLGLSLVKHIAENHGAIIDVETSLGIGSTFYVTFPANPNETPRDIG
ncbi:MAG: HAMP domain-containing protein [Actinobacteria bacterium]|nr:HAMP domain-containing protein [Actinomycetota bacterium]